MDTERASGYRYGQSAYLIQLRRDGAGTFLIDPIAVPGLPGLANVRHAAKLFSVAKKVTNRPW